MTDPLFPNYHKAIIAIHEEHGMLAKVPFDVGNILNRTVERRVATNAQRRTISTSFITAPQRVGRFGVNSIIGRQAKTDRGAARSADKASAD